MSKSVVYVKFPKAGLGNMMLTWSRAYVFSVLNNLEMCTSSWTKIHFGAVLRNEKSYRLYLGYFVGSSIAKKLRFFFYKKYKKIVGEPAVNKLQTVPANTLFLFHKIFTDYDFFKEIRPHKETVRNGIFTMLSPELKKQYEEFPKPVIGMHIRRGDFKKGSTLTPLSFFMDVVKKLREDANEDLEVTIFTDAEKREIEEILKLDNIQISPPKPDILDILLLASSKVVVLSIGSTFSYWAAFLSKGKIIKNEKEWHVPFRNSFDENFAEEIVWKNN